MKVPTSVAILLAAVLLSPAFASSTPAPATSAAPSATSRPIVRPHDAPAVRATTAPFSPARNAIQPPPPDTLWYGSQLSIVVPMLIHGGRPYIDAILNGHPATFLVDTGSVATLVDPEAAGATGPIALQIGDLRFPHLGAQRTPLRSFTQTNFGAPADGLIGRDLLLRYPVRLDFPDRQVTIYRNSASAGAALPPAAMKTALQVIDGRPAVQGSLGNDAGLWLSLITGSGFEVQLNPLPSRRMGIAKNDSVPYQEAAPTGGISGELVRGPSLTLGGLTFRQPLIALVGMQDPPASVLAGAIGARLLSRLDLLLDESSGTLNFLAPPGATAAQLFLPSGIALEMKDGGIVVQTVIPGSPGDAARVRAGDEIVAVNGLVPATLDFARQLLDQAPGTDLTIVLKRGNRERSVGVPLRVLL